MKLFINTHKKPIKTFFGVILNFKEGKFRKWKCYIYLTFLRRRKKKEFKSFICVVVIKIIMKLLLKLKFSIELKRKYVNFC